MIRPALDATRRAVIFGAMGAAVLPRSLRAADAVYRIGVLTDLSGPYSDFAGKGSVEGVRMAAEDFGGVLLGRKLEVIAGDHQNKPDVGLSIARQWIDERNVIMIADLISAAVAISVQKLAGEKDVAAIVSGTPTSELSGKYCTATSVHFTDDTFAISKGIVEGIDVAPGEQWYFLVADYAFGDQFLRDLTGALVARGGVSAGVSRHPIGESDYSSYILAAQASGAKTIAFVNAGTDTANSIKQAREFGITDAYRLVAPVFPPQTILGIGPAAAENVVSATGFVWDMNDRTRAISERFRARTGYLPGTAHYSGYAGTLAFLHAAQAEGVVSGAAVVGRLRQHAIDPATGLSGRITSTGRLDRDIMVTGAKAPGASKYPDDVLAIRKTLSAGAIGSSPSDDACPLARRPVDKG